MSEGHGASARALWSLTATELGAAYRTGVATPAEATQACLARLDAVNPILNAVVTVDRDGAARAAEAATERWRRAAPLSALDGVPVTIKDNLFVGGLRATWGSRLYGHFTAPQDDLPVAKLRAAGAVILGKTNTPELALAGYTDNLVFGATGNPWDPSLSPGGSSGGAAAAVMSGIAPLAVCTDAGGSTRRPAGHVGCVGLKPSVGRVPRRYGFPPLASDFQAIGAMARTVSDARLLFDGIATPRTQAVASATALRIGAFCRIGEAPVEPEIVELWRMACAQLSEQGHCVAEIAAPYDADEVGELFAGVAAVGVARAVRPYAGWEAMVTPAIAQFAERGFKTDAAAYVDLLDRVAAFRWRMADLFADSDVLLTPTAAGLLWPKTEPAPKMIAGRAASPRASSIYTTFANLAGLAGINAPAGMSSAGHPIGVQLVGPMGSEELLLDLAGQLERKNPWPALAPLA
jgi:aspartyl-tRNA(Asn)/glutamyl-tRNA(Gln) amidotransferase subunit A